VSKCRGRVRSQELPRPFRESDSRVVGDRSGDRSRRPASGSRIGGRRGSRSTDLAAPASALGAPGDLSGLRSPETTVTGTSTRRGLATRAAGPPRAARRSHFFAAPRARAIADRFASSALATASFVAKIALALERAGGGINHGTVRNVLDSSRAIGEHLPITLSTGFSFTSSRVTPSRQAALSPTIPRAKPSRSDRSSVGCMSREDQGGPQ
jgi:hypothetical protein